MAARGRFGRSDTGTSNLSALIRQLVSQQQAMEEKAIMDAFYGGLQYNGSVPTIDDVKAFYKKWTDLTGIQPGDADWNVIQQKVEGANNFDINRSYKILQSEFTASNGANFQKVVDFLNGRAKESTDPNDSLFFGDALKGFASNYINYRAQDLIDGTINLEQYRSIANDALAMVDPNDPVYKSMLIDSYGAEWRSEQDRQYKLVQGGKLSASSYIKWMKSFESEILAAGIPKGGALYADIIYRLGQARGIGGGGGGAGSTKMKQIGTDLMGLWTGINSLTGSDKKFNFGDTTSIQSVLKDIMNNPDRVEAAAQLLDDNPSATPAALRAFGITDGQSLRDAFRKNVGDGRNLADYLAASGTDSNYSLWVRADNIAGGTNVLGVLKHIDDMWKKMKSDAKGLESKLQGADEEYLKYLSNIIEGTNYKTVFGPPPFGNVTQEVYDLIQAQYLAMKGQADGRETLSTYNELDSEADKARLELSPEMRQKQYNDAIAVESGKKVQLFNKNTGVFETVNPINLGTNAGYFHRVILGKHSDGSIYANVAVYSGDSVLGEDGKPSRLSTSIGLTAYETETGIILVDMHGNEYDSSSYTFDLEGKVTLATGMEEPSQSKGVAAVINYDDLLTKKPEVIGETPLAELQKIDAQTIRAASQAAGSVVSGLDGSTMQVFQDAVNKMASDANTLDSIAMSMEPTNKQTKDMKIAIAEAQGNTEYANFLKTKSMFYTESSDGIWALKPEYANQQQPTAIESAFGFRDQSGIMAALSLPANIVQGVQDFFQGNNLQPVVDFRENKQPIGAPTDWAASRGYAPASPLGANPFFRNLAPSTLPTPQQLTVPTSAGLSFQPLTPLTPPKPVTPIVQQTVALGSKDLMGVAGDSLRERRDTLIRLNAQSALPVPIRSAGQGGGGV